jgi:peptidoglycan/LPS O-acetylase OafA/YrhL
MPSRHFPRLDGLRGVAILLVLLHQLDHIEGGGLAARVLGYTLDFGWTGVQLFFVLSGFLITGILLDGQSGPSPYRHFIVRRALRIFPLYYGALFAFTIVLPALGLIPASYREHAVWYWLYVSNWTEPAWHGQLPHFWSLAVEEQFYLLWPLLVLNARPSTVLRACIGVALVAVAARIAMVLEGIPSDVIYMSSLSRMDALAAGGAVAAWMRLPARENRAGPPASRVWMLAAGVFVVGFLGSHFYPRTKALGEILGYSFLSASFALALLALVREDESKPGGRGTRWLTSTPMRRLGLYSYGMYVFHKPLIDLVGKPILAAWNGTAGLAPLPGLAFEALGIGATFLAGMASYHLYERHFLAWREPKATPPDAAVRARG